MKIYVLGSNSFVKDMVARKDELRQLGYDGWIHEDYENHVKGKVKAFSDDKRENAQYKISHDYIRSHYKHILESDAILIVNNEKHGVKNYIGGNVLMEMGMAYVNDKKIFFLNDMPTEAPYLDEIHAMQPICLHGNLNNISKNTRHGSKIPRIIRAKHS